MAMREHLFRGKNAGGDGWIYGVPLDDEIIRNAEGFVVGVKIKPETVCEFTGLTDRGGVKIFEGDILQSRASEIQSEWKYWEVEYLDGSFVFSHSDIIYRKKRKYEENLLCADNIELYRLYVIGNIFDNPELMEVNKNER